MCDSHREKITLIKKKFASFRTPEERYAHLIELGRTLSPYPSSLKTPEHLVSGCQSLLYLHADYKDEKIFLTAHSDSLISAGLASLVISAYSGLAPSELLLSPPTFLQELGLFTSLSPNRANGLAQIFLKMKLISLRYCAN